MRMHALPVLSGILIAAFAAQSQAASSFGRSYAFDFRNGNLIRNWSFEALADNWFDDAGTTARYLAKKDGISAVSGSFVAKHSSTNTTGSPYRRLIGEYIPVEAGITYTFSAYVKTSGNTAGVHPYLAYFTDRSTTANGTATGPNYPVNADWNLKTFQFTPPAGTQYAQLSLLEVPANEGGTFYFDDVVIETGVSTASNRDSIQESVSFVNDAGEALQTDQKISGGGYNSSRTYLVKSASVDYALRPVRDYMPFPRAGAPDYDAVFSSDAAHYYDGTNGMGSSGGYPFTSTEYSESLARPIASTSMAGQPWNPTDGSRKMKSGSYYTSSLTAPADPEAESFTDAELPYLYSWEKDVEGRYTLSWKNALGQVVQTAVKPNSTWLYTRYEYFAGGQLKKVLQDSDVPGDDAHQDFKQVTNYNSAGEATSTYTQDKGLRKYWYNRLGQLRFTRHESQATDEYDYISYDASDRPYSMGVQVIPGMGTANVEQRDTPSGKTEQKGVIYDNLTTFQSRTGLLLSDILPMINVGLNGEGRVVCEYNLNKSVNLSSFSAKDRFVATFYNYNSYGEVTDAYKYIGPVRNPDKRIHRIIYFYDNNHRMYQTMLQDNGSTPLITYQHYDFDPLGRIVKVSGASGKFYASYSYYDWGGLKSVVMGGTGSSNSGTRMDFNYHAQGWVKEIRATRQATNEVEFQQFLGYEDQAVGSNTIPGVVPKYDGSITQQLIKFAQDLDASNPIRVTNYQYDNLDRMLTADTRKNSGTPPWDANKQIIFGSLQLTDTYDQDSRLTFDNNGRIATNQSGVATADQATYAYQGNSYKLDHVTGKLNPDTQRDASPAGTFTYDARGRLTGDASKKLTIAYGWDNMPLQFDVDTGDSLYSDREFYDAQGSRVCRVRIKTQAKVWVPIFDGEMTILVKGYLNPDALTPKVVQSITDVNLLNSGDRRWVETYDDVGAIASSSGKSGVFGISGQIGELNSDGSYRYFVKNHLGSIMRTVGEDGEYLDGSGGATDYLAYGTQKKLKTGSTEQVQSFTGKEQEDATGEYAFGARWYDSDLGMWLGPDPAEEFVDPYSYVGENVTNRIDPNGLSSLWDPFGWFTSDPPGGGKKVDPTSPKGAVQTYVDNPDVRAAINTYMYVQSQFTAEAVYWSLWTITDCMTCAQAGKSLISSTGRKYFVDGKTHRKMEAGPFSWDLDDGEFDAENPHDLLSDDVSGGRKLKIVGDYAALATDGYHAYKNISALLNPSPIPSASASSTPAKSTTWHGNYLGPGNNGMDKLCIDAPDCAARTHDIFYNLLGANGPPDAILNPLVGPADLLLAATGLISYALGVGDQTPTTGGWELGVGGAFGLFSSYKLAYLGSLYQDLASFPSDIRKINSQRVNSY